ncbi:hypothetical protein D3C74_311770 [compost metagenome]
MLLNTSDDDPKIIDLPLSAVNDQARDSRGAPIVKWYNNPNWFVGNGIIFLSKSVMR